MTEVEQRNINREFFKSAIKRQMMRCTTKEHYKAGVFTMDTKMSIVTDIVKEIAQNDFAEYLMENKPIRISQYTTEVFFKNGSIFRVVKTTMNSRGCKFNDIIYDSLTEDEVVSMIILPCLMPYYTNNYENNEMGIDGVRPNARLIECEI